MRTSHAKKTTLPVEIYSTDTLRPVDLCAALSYELGRLRLTRKERATVTKAATLARNFDRYRDEAYDEKYHDAYEALVEVAENHLAPYTYYGSSEGDGACIGVWVDFEGVRESIRDEDIAVCDEDGLAPAGHGGLAAFVSDHGNITLYNVRRGRYTEVWSAV